MDVPAPLIFLLTLNWVGRKVIFVASHLILGIACIAMAFVPKSNVDAVLALFLVGKMAAGISFTLAYLVTSELYPTNLRSQAVGVCSTISRVTCLLAPFLAPLANIWQPLPMLVLGFPTLVSGT